MGAEDPETLVRRKHGTRITPRTCLWPLAVSLVVTFGLSIGLTFRSNHHCYAGTCGEWLFPLQARLHVVVWYAWLSLATTFLAVRAFHPEMQRGLARHVVERKLPFLHKHITRGGLLMLCWIFCLYGTVIGIWWPRLHEYFTIRNAAAGITKGSDRLAAIALTGHLCDITMGMVLLPISRHSALASFFQIAVSTTLTNHMMLAYLLFSLVIIHGCFYISWIPTFNGLSTELQKVIPVLNPTYLYRETWPGNESSLGVWRASLIFTGCLAAFIMAVLFVTTIPKVRANHFNLFYFSHFASILMVVIICLHASTMFYCTAPGLAMWLLDWSMRVYELRRTVSGDIATLGRGWYCITVSLPRARLTGCSCRSPIAHFYIHHARSSIRELHPFTTITHLATQNSTTDPADPDLAIQFLFRKQGKQAPDPDPERAIAPPPLCRRLFCWKSKFVKSDQWTTRLASLAEKETWAHDGNDRRGKAGKPVDVSLRLEGPYFTPAVPYHYDMTVCIVAGSGISGALAIGAAFKNLASPSTPSMPDSTAPTDSSLQRWRHCIIIWSIKAGEEIDLPFLEPLAEGMEVRKFVTGGRDGGGRVDLEKEMAGLVFRDDSGGQRTWVYISGPKGFIASGKMACSKVQKKGANLDFYAASWDP